MSSTTTTKYHNISKKAEHLRRCIASGKIDLKEIDTVLAEVGSIQSAPQPSRRKATATPRKEFYKTLLR